MIIDKKYRYLFNFIGSRPLLTSYANNPYIHLDHLWDVDTVVPDDPSIKAWLEAFCLIANSQKMPTDLLEWSFHTYVSMYAVAINNDSRYVIKPIRSNERHAEFVIVEY